jgi:hypothetical protein
MCIGSSSSSSSFLKFLNFKNMMTNNNKKSNLGKLLKDIAPKGGQGESLTLPKTAADIVFLVGPIVLGSANDFTDSEGAGILITSAVAAVGSFICAFGAFTSSSTKKKKSSTTTRVK